MKEKKAIRETFNELSSHYEESMDGELNKFWGWSYQRFLDELVKITPISSGQMILDIATGTSVIPRKIASMGVPGVEITGLDFTESMLRQGKEEISKVNGSTRINLTCGDAMALPFSGQVFDVVISGLASHHMDIPKMLSEKKRVLKPGGLLSFIDVGMSPFWELPIIRGITRVITFFYFLFQNNPARAWAEAAAISNTRTPEGWQKELEAAGFIDIKISKLSSKYRWVPEPLTIQSTYKVEEK